MEQGEGYDAIAEIMPDLPEELKSEIIFKAETDSEVYLAKLNSDSEYIDGMPSEPDDVDVLNYITKFNTERGSNMTDQEAEIYDIAFRSRFAKGYKEPTIN